MMTSALNYHLESLTPTSRTRLERHTVEALRLAWPHRQTRRARHVIYANVAMLRNLRGL